MQFIPSIKSHPPSDLWKNCSRLELRFHEPILSPAWVQRIREGLELRTVHLPLWQPSTSSLDLTRSLLQPPFDLDFLVLPVPVLSDRTLAFQFLSTIEVLLEMLSGRGIKIALKSQDDPSPLVTLLKSIRADAIGYCWEARHSECAVIADRIFVAYGTPQDSFQPLYELGYRWDIGLEVSSPEDFQMAHARLKHCYPDPIFPKQLPNVSPDPDVSLGEHWNLQ